MNRGGRNGRDRSGRTDGGGIQRGGNNGRMAGRKVKEGRRRRRSRAGMGRDEKEGRTERLEMRKERMNGWMCKKGLEGNVRPNWKEQQRGKMEWGVGGCERKGLTTCGKRKEGTGRVGGIQRIEKNGRVSSRSIPYVPFLTFPSSGCWSGSRPALSLSPPPS